MKTFHRSYFEEYSRLRQRVNELKSLPRKSKTKSRSTIKFEPFDIDLILQEDFTIGQPSTQHFNIQESVCFSHNYFRRRSSLGDRALCLMCLKSTEKKEVYLSYPNNSSKGLLNHLMAKHSEYKEQISLQKAAVQSLRNEKRKAMLQKF